MQPYPVHLVQRLSLKDGAVVTIRPIRPEDARIEQEFVRNLSDESRYYRFMRALMGVARKAGLRVMFGEVLASNHKMLQFTAGLGFTARFDERDPRTLQVENIL